MPGSNRSHCPELFQHWTRSSKHPLHSAAGLYNLLPPVPPQLNPQELWVLCVTEAGQNTGHSSGGAYLCLLPP